jgi:uncharacterized protein (TIGR01777 family)
MTATVLVMLTLQILFGALDNVLHHELTERLPQRPSARYELTLHSAREAIYGCLFLVFAWMEPQGLFAVAVLMLLGAEIVITLADFLEEDRTRSLPPFERVLHTVLAIFYGGFLISVIPWLATSALAPSTVTFASHGLFSWFFTVSSIGVFAFSIRNAIAVRVLWRHNVETEAHPPSGRTVLVTGGTGFVGSALVARLLARGDRLIVLSRDTRQARVLLGDRVHHIAALTELPVETQIDAVVNLAGAPIIGLPWTASRRKAIWNSRVKGTEALVAWMGTLERAPRVLVSGSAIGFYGDRIDEVLTESAPRGEGFAADLCDAWECAARHATAIGIRVVCLRIGLVLEKRGGALPMMALPARFGLGAVFGNGRQWMSWITRNDLLRLIVSAIDSDRWSGAVNAVAPEPTRHADFQNAIARTFRRPLFLAAPAWALRLGMGEMATIFLHSQRVVPERALAAGFAFDVHWAADALMLLLGPASAGESTLKEPLQSAKPLEETTAEQGTPTGDTYDDHRPRSPAIALRPQGTSGTRGEAA